MIENFTPLASTLGGALIGLAAAILLFFNGKIAGISGILSGLLPPRSHDTLWRAAFIAGLLIGGLAVWQIAPQAFNTSGQPSLGWLALAGLLVGLGTSIARGCTSGHGVCGLARLSRRSAAATLSFVFTAMVTVYILRHVLAGG